MNSFRHPRAIWVCALLWTAAFVCSAVPAAASTIELQCAPKGKSDWGPLYLSVNIDAKTVAHWMANGNDKPITEPAFVTENDVKWDTHTVRANNTGSRVTETEHFALFRATGRLESITEATPGRLAQDAYGELLCKKAEPKLF